MIGRMSSLLLAVSWLVLFRLNTADAEYVDRRYNWPVANTTFERLKFNWFKGGRPCEQLYECRFRVFKGYPCFLDYVNGVPDSIKAEWKWSYYFYDEDFGIEVPYLASCIAGYHHYDINFHLKFKNGKYIVGPYGTDKDCTHERFRKYSIKSRKHCFVCALANPAGNYSLLRFYMKICDPLYTRRFTCKYKAFRKPDVRQGVIDPLYKNLLIKYYAYNWTHDQALEELERLSGGSGTEPPWNYMLHGSKEFYYPEYDSSDSDSQYEDSDEDYDSDDKEDYDTDT